MKHALLLLASALAFHAEAGQEWQLISITRGLVWEVNQARGILKQDGHVLEGTLMDSEDGNADYSIRIELTGEVAEATFRFISEGDEHAELRGTYMKAKNPTNTHCPEQIQLMNMFQYIGLARNACQP